MQDKWGPKPVALIWPACLLPHLLQGPSGLLRVKPSPSDLTVLGTHRPRPSCVPFGGSFRKPGHELLGAGALRVCRPLPAILCTAEGSDGGPERLAEKVPLPDHSWNVWTRGRPSGPGLVDVAEELGSSGALGERGAMSAPAFRPSQSPCGSLPSGTGGLWGRPGRLSLHAHC